LAIESKATLDFKGIKVDVVGAYSRFTRAIIDVFSGTKLVFRDYKDKDAATRKMSKRSIGVDYDQANPDHVAQYEAAGSPDLSELDANGKPWRATEIEEYWDGNQTEGELLQEREVQLSSEIALAFAAQALTGTLPQQPKDALEMLTAQAYLAAIATGEFPEAKAV
jgi:hypothetical protein